MVEKNLQASKKMISTCEWHVKYGQNTKHLYYFPKSVNELNSTLKKKLPDETFINDVMQIGGWGYPLGIKV